MGHRFSVPLYQFSRVPAGRESVGAAHASELPYVFGTLSMVGQFDTLLGTALNAPKYGAIDVAVSDQIQRYWTNFAKNGDPNGPSLPTWPRFNPAARAFIDLTPGGPVAREGLRREECDLFIANSSRK